MVTLRFLADVSVATWPTFPHFYNCGSPFDNAGGKHSGLCTSPAPVLTNPIPAYHSLRPTSARRAESPAGRENRAASMNPPSVCKQASGGARLNIGFRIFKQLLRILLQRCHAPAPHLSRERYLSPKNWKSWSSQSPSPYKVRRCSGTTVFLHLTRLEIDHNFSRAHRIVTSSILPIVGQYAEHSREVWEGSRVGFHLVLFASSAY